MIRKVNPAYASEGSKNSVFRIEDAFLRFWFRYVFKCQQYVERGYFHQLRTLVEADFDAFSGPALERYFEWKFSESTSYTSLAGWWDRKGENEIDLVCEDELNGAIDFIEVKRDAKAIDLKVLESKVARFLEKHPEKSGLRRRCLGLSLADM